MCFLAISLAQYTKSMGERIADPSTAAVLKEFFGQELALVFYPPATDPGEIVLLSDKDMYNFVRKMFSNVLLVTRPRGKGVFVDFLARFLQYNAKLQPETVDVAGYTLRYVTLPGTEIRIGFVNIHDLLVVGIDKHILEQSVRTSRREIPAFSSDAHLRRSRERAMVPSEFDGYWNMAEISAYTNEYLGALVSRMEEEIRDTAAPQEQDSPERDERDERNERNDSGEEEVLKILRNISIELINTDYGVRAFLDGQEVSDEIFKPDVSKTVPIVAAFPKVRKEMVLRQQGMAKDAVRREKNIVMEGRDIATDVLRDADIKIYLTADINTRTQRRLKQLTERGIKTSFDEVLKDIEARDGRDTERTASPLRIAEDAVIIDTTNDTIDQTVDKVMEKLKEKNLI